VIKWLNAKEAVEFGESLAEFFARRIPLVEEENQKVISKANRRAVLNEMVRKIDKFKEEHSMNFYKKAKLGNAFKWKLLEAGFAPDIVDSLTKQILIKL